ncbi:hypothetical protein CNN00155 [Cryptococcus deneoformans JEC21]|uniref:Uncharacterized protein n=1 Tax=Cryptococcus deneoformans (strain JEC21 / ATCC MYA-565) TaxID=214684 RepID=A0A0S2M6H1_CRYD1|nr:hypothetical protein CNN00155 [Cryptococcus neoformans var. neoformans JEC21]ALO69791.1 hypothetical protein CNN00155 [Cryptococcus neoformans var. neoformans JEC21]
MADLYAICRSNYLLFSQRIETDTYEASKPGSRSSVVHTGFWIEARGVDGKQDLTRDAAPGERMIYFIVGGGYMGRHPLRIHTPWPLAKISKARVFSVSYRKSLSDSTAFPCSLLDTLAGYQYLIEEKHFEHKNIILCGDLPTRLSTWLVFSWGWCQLVLTLLSTTPLPSIQILFLWPPCHLHREVKYLRKVDHNRNMEKRPRFGLSGFLLVADLPSEQHHLNL